MPGKTTGGGHSRENGGLRETDARILQALRRLMRALDINSRRLAAETGLTSGQLSCMKLLSQDDVDTATAVARGVHLSPSTVVGIFDRLEEKRLIERVRDKKDRRVVRVTLTTEGRRLVRETPHPVTDLLEREGNGLSRDESARIADALESLVKVLGATELDGSTPYGELVDEER